jgi:putative colanic acid biosynthesis acetyltransferase WcaF
MVTRLDRYDNSWYSPGATAAGRIVWYFVNHLIFNHGLLPINGLKVFLLRLFGAKVGKGVVIKPCVNIKYPWRLCIGDYTWIGERVWIDNLAQVTIGAHCCLSQESLLICGNHNYKKTSFDLITGEIHIADGVWIGAKSIVGPGVTCLSHSVLSVGSTTFHDLKPYHIYQGNPATAKRKREIY